MRLTQNLKVVIMGAIPEEIESIKQKFTTSTTEIIAKREYTSGKIASGDQFIYHPEKLLALKEDMPDVSAVEMEGAAVAQVCDDHKIPFVVLRTISDKADHSAAIDFQAFVSEVVPAYSSGIIEEMYKTGLNF